MSVLRKAFVVLLLAAASACPAAAQEHWLIGKWTGAMTNLPTTNRFGSERTLEVKSVSPDGKAQASWTGGAGTQQVAVTVSGNEITFATPTSAGASYRMAHSGGTLSGTWSAAGGSASGGINLKKQ
ncbi:MAG: hypothetical protein AB7R90_04460 [Reyranellaceae bacterium]